jgi:drug/metabolite transporter (DMT)-like permease
LGYFAGGEALGPRTIVGTACVLVSVIVITTAAPVKQTEANASEQAMLPSSATPSP